MRCFCGVHPNKKEDETNEKNKVIIDNNYNN